MCGCVWVSVCSKSESLMTDFLCTHDLHVLFLKVETTKSVGFFVVFFFVLFFCSLRVKLSGHLT